MKKLHELTLGAAFTLLALLACDNEALLPDALQMNEPDNPNACLLVGDDFRWEGNESRTALTVEDNVAKFSWTTGDKVGILPDEGAQVYFTIPEVEALAEGDELTDELRRKASFDGGAWALKAESNYAAYYPFIEDFYLDRTKVPVDYTGQKQTGNNNAAHLGAYDYMGARPVTTNAEGGGVTFDFDHVGALVLLKFTVPEAGTALKSVTLSADEVTFTTQGTYDLASTDGFPIAATATATELTVDVDYTTTQAAEEVTVYFMCAPVDLSGKSVNVSVAYGDADATLNLMADGKNLEAANGYALAAIMGNITDPAQVKKGDYAMKDGTFIKYDANATLTDVQKANVAGIVFWTTADMNTDANAQTPAKLTDDKIMATDFPHCTHGLIVSLKDVSTGTKWQSTSTNISDWQSNTFVDEKKDDYKSIASSTDATDLVNYILGYQNTKLLKAYNEQCEEDNKVLPVSLLADFETNNPAPVKTTGWFIPTVKELSILCYKDVDNVGSLEDMSYIETREAVNASLKKVNGDIFGNNYYWSSTEYEYLYDYAFLVLFGYAQVTQQAKHNVSSGFVRAVCAF